VLRAASTDEAVVGEVFRYCESPFRVPVVPAPVLPQADEPHVAAWRTYAASCGDDPFGYLAARLPQLAIPVRAGISATAPYGEVMRKGAPFEPGAFDGTLSLRSPSLLRLTIHEHPAGALPVLGTSDRADFETLFQALACRHEPVAVSPAVNAQIVSGFLNWDRVQQHRTAWAATVDPFRAMTAWPAELARIGQSERWRIQDKVLLTCDRTYSSVSAADLGLPFGEDEWLERSRVLRVEHEFTHYATKRVFGSMSLNLLDETIADFMGVTYALDRPFRAAWFLRFLGLEDWPAVRPSGRAGTYASSLSPDALRVLLEVTVAAAHGLEAVAARHYDAAQRPRFFVALASLSLELLASPEATDFFAEAWSAAEPLTS
jgi:hypothetical protein